MCAPQHRALVKAPCLTIELSLFLAFFIPLNLPLVGKESNSACGGGQEPLPPAPRVTRLGKTGNRTVTHRRATPALGFQLGLCCSSVTATRRVHLSVASLWSLQVAMGTANTALGASAASHRLSEGKASLFCSCPTQSFPQGFRAGRTCLFVVQVLSPWPALESPTSGLTRPSSRPPISSPWDTCCPRICAMPLTMSSHSALNKSQCCNEETTLRVHEQVPPDLPTHLAYYRVHDRGPQRKTGLTTDSCGLLWSKPPTD